MAFQKPLWALMAIFITFISSSHAKTFEVGGKDGWTVHPSENYNQWSGRLRFLINDTLHFKYDGGSDSVLVVNKGDYDGCNTGNPIKKLDGGDSSFKFDRSGPFYFISGNKSNCDQGQKLIVVVLALRIRSPPPSTVTPPPTAATPPASPPAPVTGTPPVPTPTSPVLPPSPSSATPVSPSPLSQSPGLPPSTAVSPSSPPSTTVSPPSGSPELSPPALSPGGGGSASSPGGGGSASSPGGAADVNTPPSGTPSSSPPPLPSGAGTASLLTVVFALWWIN